MRETWYVLENGACVDPAEVAPDNDGRLRHKSGAAIAMRGSVPSTSGVDAEVLRGKPNVKADKPKRAYNTRELKAD